MFCLMSQLWLRVHTPLAELEYGSRVDFRVIYRLTQLQYGMIDSIDRLDFWLVCRLGSTRTEIDRLDRSTRSISGSNDMPLFGEFVGGVAGYIVVRADYRSDAVVWLADEEAVGKDSERERKGSISRRIHFK